MRYGTNTPPAVIFGAPPHALGIAFIVHTALGHRILLATRKSRLILHQTVEFRSIPFTLGQT